MGDVRYSRLLPVGAEIDARSYVGGLGLGPSRPDRPYLIGNFVASVDGHATVDQQSRKLSGRADRELFDALRERVDAVLIGTGTLAAENYKRMLPQEERRARRIASGRPEEPLAVTVTRSGRIPREIPLFEDEKRVLVFESTGLSEMLSTLRHDHDIGTVLCEGGPTLFGALLEEHLVDELFLTLAPTLVGGASGPGLARGLYAQRDVELIGALESDGAVFLRYRL